MQTEAQLPAGLTLNLYPAITEQGAPEAPSKYRPGDTLPKGVRIDTDAHADPLVCVDGDKHPSRSIVLAGDGPGSLGVHGRTDCRAVRDGAGRGDAINAGPGLAERGGSGDGDAIATSANGKAARTGRGNGNALDPDNDAAGHQRGPAANGAPQLKHAERPESWKRATGRAAWSITKAAGGGAASLGVSVGIMAGFNAGMVGSNLTRDQGGHVVHHNNPAAETLEHQREQSGLIKNIEYDRTEPGMAGRLARRDNLGATWRQPGPRSQSAPERPTSSDRGQSRDQTPGRTGAQSR